MPIFCLTVVKTVTKGYFVSPRRIPKALVWIAAVIAGWATLFSGTALFAADPEQTKQARELAKGESLSGDDLALFDKVVGDELQRMVKVSEANLPLLPKLRGQFLKLYLLPGKNGDPRNRVLVLTLAKAKQVLEGDSPLPVKANFVLLLGDLDETSSTSGPAKPSKQAFDMLLALTQPKTVSNDSDALLVEALVGLQRHAQIYRQPGAAPPDGGSAKLSQAMLAILKESTPPAGRSADGHHWMRKLAGQILAQLGSPGEDNQVAKALETAMRDPQAPLFFRVGIAQYVGELKYDDSTEPSPAAMAKILLELAHDACRNELAKARRSRREPSQQALKQWLEALQDGFAGAAKGQVIAAPSLRGLNRAVSAVPDSKEAIQTAKKDIDKLLEMVNNREFVKLAQAVARQGDSTSTTARRE